MESTFPLILPGTGKATIDTEIRLTSILAARKDLLYCELVDSAVMLDLGSGIYYGLDPVGTCIWGLIQEPKVLSDIIAAMLEEYAVEPARCEQDLRSFLSEMVSRNLIEVRNP